MRSDLGTVFVLLWIVKRIVKISIFGESAKIFVKLKRSTV